MIETRRHAAAAANHSAELRYVAADGRVKPARVTVDHSRRRIPLDGTSPVDRQWITDAEVAPTGPGRAPADSG